MDWFKCGLLAIIILGILSIKEKLFEIEKDMAIIKTVLIMKGVMPTELSKGEK